MILEDNILLPETNYEQEFHLNLILSISWNVVGLLLFEAFLQVFEDYYQIYLHEIMDLVDKSYKVLYN